MLMRRDAWAISLLSISAFGSAGIAFGVQAGLARTLQPHEYGSFASALAVLMIVAPAVGFGLPAFWLKVYGTEGWMATRWMNSSTRFVRINSLVCLAVGGAWALFCTNQPDTTPLIFCMLPVVLTQGMIEMASAKYQLEERFGLVAAWQAFQHISRFVVVLACAYLNAGVLFVAIGFGCIGIAVAVGAWWTLSSMRTGNARLVGHGPKPVIDASESFMLRPTAFQLLRNVHPFGIASLLYFAYGQAGLIQVAHISGPHNAGLYSIAVTVLTAIYLFPTILFQKLLMPRLHRWAASNDARLCQSFTAGNRWMFVLGIIVGAALAIASPTAIPLVFGPRYADAVPVVTLMAICAPLRFVTSSASSVMTTRGLIGIRNACAAAALSLSIIAGWILIPLWGLQGAAAAAIAGELVWTTLSVFSGRRYVLRALKTPPASEFGQIANGACAKPVVRNLAPVTVIVPCHNCISTVERAVASVCSQTCRPAQLILIDDCSTDETLQLLEEMKRAYGVDWIRVLLQPRNSGPGAARNAGWELATQPYVAFLDSDDSWHQRKIEVQYDWMKRHPHVSITGHPVQRVKDCEPIAPVTVGAPIPVSRWRILFSNHFTPSSIMVRADVRARFDETKRYAEDYFMLLELALVEKGTCYLFPTPLSLVYKRQFGAQTGLSSKLWKMQKGEQENYQYFKKVGAIHLYEWIFFSMISFAKYIRRCLLSGRFN